MMAFSGLIIKMIAQPCHPVKKKLTKSRGIFYGSWHFVLLRTKSHHGKTTEFCVRAALRRDAVDRLVGFIDLITTI